MRLVIAQLNLMVGDIQGNAEQVIAAALRARDQHRADMAELRGELKEEIAGLRQDVAVLAKTVEHLGQTMVSGFTDMRQAISGLNARLDRQAHKSAQSCPYPRRPPPRCRVTEADIGTSCSTLLVATTKSRDKT